MKRIFYFVMAAVLCVAACQKVDPIEQIGKKGEVAFTVNLPGSIGTKAISDGEKALKLFYATYTDGGKMIESLSNTTEGVAVSGKKATIKLQLVKDLNYDVVFWAQAEECKAYTFYWENATMTVDYKGLANDDYRDAFYAVRQDLIVTDGLLEETVYLYRPFAQINFGAADYDSVVEYYDQVSVDKGMQSALLKAMVPNTLNLLDESLGDATSPVDYVFASIPNDPRELTVNGEDYKYVSMNYILAPKGNTPAILNSITADFQFVEGNINRSIEVKNVPYLRNHRTNIIGNFFTETALLNIVLDEIFEKPDYDINIPSGEFTQHILDSLAAIAGKSIDVPAYTWNLPAKIASGVTFVCEEGTLFIVGKQADPFTLAGKAKLLLDNTVINTAEKSAITLAENAEMVIEVVGKSELTAAGNAIDVRASASLTVTGNELVVTGGAGTDSDNGGSGIGGDGEIVVDGLNYLTANGFGKGGYGIGGTAATVVIKDVKEVLARGGYPQQLFVNDTKYGKSEPEGAPAIGGAVIRIENSTITKAEGGSKAAAIGARYHQSTDITILNSTITEAIGGNASAGIGGSRYMDFEGKTEGEVYQSCKIKIENSTVTATGGQAGAGIGSGYDTHCKASAKYAVNDITILNSTIKAQGGKYAAGIGTGYHAAALTGSIDDESVIDAKCGEDFYKAEYTLAQNVGYGVVDPTREAAGLVVTFAVAGTVIDSPIK